MRVTIGNKLSERQEEVAGFWASLFTTRKTIKEYIVSLKIELTEEERAILAAHQLWDVQILTRPFYVPADYRRKIRDAGIDVDTPVPYTIKDLVGTNAQGDTFKQFFLTPVDAANFETELKNDILPKLKNYIAASRNAGDRPSEQTFEL